MKSYVLKHQKLQSGCVVSNTIEVFLDSSQAMLKAILLNKSVVEDEAYTVETAEFNDSESLAVERAGDEVFLIGENRNTIDIDVTFTVEEFDSFQGSISSVVYDDISIYGICLRDLPISEELKNEIREVAKEAADELNENK